MFRSSVPVIVTARSDYPAEQKDEEEEYEDLELKYELLPPPLLRICVQWLRNVSANVVPGMEWSRVTSSSHLSSQSVQICFTTREDCKFNLHAKCLR